MRRICLTVRADVKEFAGDTPASGDITLLAMWVDRREYRSMTVPGDSDRLDEVTGFVEEVLSSGGCPMNTILKMQIVAEEIFVNICDYAYKGVKGVCPCSADTSTMRSSPPSATAVTYSTP